MKLIVNSLITPYDELIVKMSINEVTRQFNFKDISNIKKHNIGDTVEIIDENGLLLKGVIEYIQANEEGYVYAGRNNARFIVDSYADKTIQFTEKNKIKQVLNQIAGEFGLKVLGDTPMPKETIKTILIGDKLGDAILEIVKNSGQILTSDAEGNLVIQFKAENTGDTILEYGRNIIKRTYREDDTNLYNKYKIVSQSNYVVSKKQNVNTFGEYGDGEFKKVIVSNQNLDAKECEELAKKEYMKDFRKSLSYEIETQEKLQVNTKYFIKDLAVGINEELNCKDVTITISSSEYSVKANFERVVDE